MLVRVRGVLRQDDGMWVAGFPRLDVYSQGDTPDEAKANAEQALRVWTESCLDRGTLGAALVELGWHRHSQPSAASGLGEDERIDVLHLEDELGEPWEGQLEIPAYEAAEFIAAGA